MSHVSTTSLSCNAHMSSLTARLQHEAHTRAKTITLRTLLILDAQQRRLHGSNTVLTVLYLTSNECLTSHIAQIQRWKVNRYGRASQVACAFQSERRIRQVNMCEQETTSHGYLSTGYMLQICHGWRFQTMFCLTDAVALKKNPKSDETRKTIT